MKVSRISRRVCLKKNAGRARRKLSRNFSSSSEKLKTVGLRITRARLEILHVLDKVENHLSPDRIADILFGNGFRISPATLYQNLGKLAQKGLLKFFHAPDGKMCFDSNTFPHHHLICRNCGKTVDVTLKHPFEQVLRLVTDDAELSMNKWNFQDTLSEFKAICPVCSGKDRYTP